MPSTTFEIEGLDKLVAKLDQLDTKLQNKTARKAINAAGRGVVKDARPLVPHRYGLLKISLGQRVKRYRGTHVTVIGARTRFKSKKAQRIRGGGRTASRASPGNYAHLVEFGTAPHVIKPTNARALALLGSGRPVTRVDHPGAAPKPFLRPALEANRTKAFNTMAQVIGQAIREVQA
ncbi:MAG: HK97-gp10 family putative phage morphogenesis protein [Planctomycetota bacterium]